MAEFASLHPSIGNFLNFSGLASLIRADQLTRIYFSSSFIKFIVKLIWIDSK